ncbi:MAG TPA: hypothetical protein VMY76_09895 [Gemmatimonadales bacterium]|nr:hypothetical protein [Gemmatimonadales bacterium]
MRSRLLWVVATCLMLAPPALRAQDACADNLTWPAVGRWAEYSGVYNKKTPVTSRYAVVGTETRDGVEYKWIEMKMHDEQKQRDMIYQMLVPGGPLQMDQVAEIVMKMGTDPAMKINGMMLGAIRGQLGKNSAFTDACREATLVGKEKVTVPAGTFQALHYQSPKHESDTWVDPALPFAMLRSTGKAHTFELVAMGKGAESSITEEPTEMPGLGKPAK